MVILTHSDARAYCLGVAQIIPVLMIAFFVVDSSRFVQRVENTKKAAQRTVDIVNNSFPEVQQKLQQGTTQVIEQLDEKISAFDRINRSQASKEVLEMLDATRSEQVASRAQLTERIDQINQIFQGTGARVASIESRREGLESAARKLTLVYFYGVTLSIVLALAGEVIALWGAIGLMSDRVAMACVTDVSIVLAANLTRYAIERLMPTSIPAKYHAFNIVQYCWVPILFFAQFTFVWILLNVRLHS
jgi:hypothetical protein